MKKNKRLLIGIGIVMLIGIIAIVAHKRPQMPDGDDVVRIGVILPLTGVSSDLGKPILEAMKIAEKTVQERDGRKLLLDVEDGKSTAGGTIAAYQKLMMRKPSAFVVFGDVPCNNLAPLASKNNQPVIALAAAAADIPKLCPHYYRLWVTADVSSRHISKFLANDGKVKNVAVLYSDNSYGVDFLNCLRNAVVGEKLKLSLAEAFDVSSQNVRPQIQKLLSNSPDAIVVLGFGTGYLAAFNQLLEAKYQGKIVTDETITIPAYFNGVVEQGKGVLFSATGFNPYDHDSNAYNDFIKPFEETIGTVPNAHSVFGYVAVRLLSEAIQRVEGDYTRIEEGLQKMQNVNSIIGNISYTRDREVEVPIFMKQMIGGGRFNVIGQ